jgi:hypothetical protein
MKPKDENDSGSWISRPTALAAGAAAAAVPLLSPIGAAAQSTCKPVAQTKEAKSMTSITTKDGPLASDAWDAQMLFFGRTDIA